MTAYSRDSDFKSDSILSASKKNHKNDLDQQRIGSSRKRDILFPTHHKTYADFMNELTQDDVLEGLLSNGMFSDKIPPILSSRSFFEYRSKKVGLPRNGWKGWITFRYLRNNNEYREYGIPNPFSYELLVRHISEHWDKIKDILRRNTENMSYRVSRIHPRKIAGSNAIFEMNYKNWRVDSDPIPAVLMGRRYVVRCDISKCFPSIYTHAIDWAIDGREIAKQNKHNGIKTWASILDDRAAATRNGETHGLLIGPHSSNLLSELLLTDIDKKLYLQGFRFIRNIDDYECYVDTIHDAELFIVELGKCLSEYRLSLNQSKTEVLELPMAVSQSWVRSLKNYRFGAEPISYKEAQSFLDHTIETMEKADNLSVLLYAFRMLSGFTLKSAAKRYYMDMGAHLACLYPYLTPHLEKVLILPTDMDVDRIRLLSETLYCKAISTRDYLTACYAIYFALRYRFDLSVLTGEDVLVSNDCLLKLFAFLYSKERGNKTLRDALRRDARGLQGEDFDRNWLFAYHALPTEDLPKGDWREIKKAGVRFVDMSLPRNACDS